MINIIGILIIILGIFVPHLIGPQISSLYFFWLGGLLILQKGIIIRSESQWPKWAQIGILFNIILNAFNLAANLSIGEGLLSKFEYWMTMVLYWISSPATAIWQKIYPYPKTDLPDGSVCFQISYSRTVITSFLNVATFALILALLGMFWEKERLRRSTANK